MFLSHTSEFAAYPQLHSYLDAAIGACQRLDFMVADM